MCSVRKNVSKRKPKLKNHKQLIAAMWIFAAVELAVVYCMYNIRFSFFSYICIILSCLFCAIVSDGSKTWLFTQLGLLGTVGADFFLVLIPVQQRVPGMFFFCTVQIAYFLRTYFEDQSRVRRTVNLIIRLVASAAVLVITPIVLGSRLDALSMLSIFYYVNLLCNLVFAFLNFKQSGIFAIALLAFILSDTVIGFQSLSNYFLIPRGSFVFVVIQLGKQIFYPLYIFAQISISLSIAFRRLRQESVGKQGE